MNTLYDILEVSPSASNEVIKAAYKMLTMRYHPDRNQDKPGAEEYQKRLNSAYEVLSDPIKRKAYDESLATSYQSSAAWASGNAAAAEGGQSAPPQQEPPQYATPAHLLDKPKNPWFLLFMLIPAVTFIGLLIAVSAK